MHRAAEYWTAFMSWLAELGLQTILYGSGASTGAAVFLFLLGVYLLYRQVPPENREFMDPLPGGLKLIWPLIQVIAYYFCTNLPVNMLERLEKRLQQTGVAYLLSAEQFIALRFVGAGLALAAAWLTLAMLQRTEPAWLLFALVLGFFLPELWLRDTRRKRESAVVRAMPIYLDFITMAVEAGLNLSGALSQAMEKGPRGPLRNEFGIVLRDLRSGVTRADALRRMAARLNVSEVTSFVSSMIQAERMGSSMAAVLRVQSEQRRNERFQRAEKMAMEAPIKLIGPLILFIFPVTFIVLGFPIVMKFLAEGTL